MTTVPTAGARPSRVIRRTPLAWDVEPDDAAERTNRMRIPDFAVFFALGFPGLVAPVIGLPVNELAATAMCLLAASRLPTVRANAWWFTVLLAGFDVYMLATSYLHAEVVPRRLLHLLLYAVLATFIASGRIDLRSAARGAGCGMLVSIVASFVGLGDVGYAGRLSGWIGDPNSAGYVITVLGAVAIGFADHRRLRLVLLVVLPVAVVLTYSRTTLLATTFAIVWLLVGRRVGTVTGLGIAGLMVYVVGHIPPQLRLLGPFADRSGSDALRGRIIAQERIDIAQSPHFGAGAGTAHVDVAGNTFFYHSSYLAMQREGGQVALVLFVALVVLLLIASLRLPRELRNPWAEVALISVMVCAVNLGEVLLELPAAVAVGAAMHQILLARSRGSDQDRDEIASLTRPETLAQVNRRARSGPRSAAVRRVP